MHGANMILVMHGANMILVMHNANMIDAQCKHDNG